jgi:hypothetical protein
MPFIIAETNIGLQESQSFALQEEIQKARSRASFLPQVDTSPPGHPVQVAWAPAPGATKANLTSADARIGPAAVEQQRESLSVKILNNSAEISIPGGGRVGALALGGLKFGDKTIRSVSDLENRRLVVSLNQGSGWSPLYSIPAVPARGLLPPSLIGASFSNGVLSFPDPGLAAERIRISLVEQQFPEQFAPVAFTLGSAAATVLVAPRNLQLLGPDGAPAWAFPGEMPLQAPVAEADLRFALEQRSTPR